MGSASAANVAERLSGTTYLTYQLINCPVNYTEGEHAPDRSARITSCSSGSSFAIGAAFAYSAASLLQSVGARRAAAHTDSLAGLAGQPLYVVGLVLDAAGFIAVLAALQFLPLFVVQTTVASNVAITAIGASLLLGTHLPRAGWIALVAVLAGLAVIATSAQAREDADLATWWGWVLLATSIPVAALGIWAYRRGWVDRRAGRGARLQRRRHRRASIGIPRSAVAHPAGPTFVTLAAQGVAGTLLFARAAQTSNVTQISTVTFTTETVLPSVIGVLFLHDSVRPGWGPYALGGFVLAVGGALLLSRLSASAPAGPLEPSEVARSAPPPTPPTPPVQLSG